MIIIQTNPLPLHLKSAFFGFNKAEYRTSLVSKIVTYQEANLCNPFNLSDKDNAQCLATW